MKNDKGEVALNVNIDKELSDQMTTVCKIMGKTKRAFIEEAVGRAVAPFCSYEDDGDDTMRRVCKPKKGLLIRSDEGVETRSECIILEHTTMLGADYVKIYEAGQLKKVPAEFVREVTCS